MNIKIKLFLLFFTATYATYATYACADYSDYIIKLPDCPYSHRSGNVNKNLYYCDINESIKLSKSSTHWIHFSCGNYVIGLAENCMAEYNHLDLVHSKWIHVYDNLGIYGFSASVTNWKASMQVLTVKKAYCDTIRTEIAEKRPCFS